MDMDFKQVMERITTEALVDIALNSANFQLLAAQLDALATIKNRCYKYRELGFYAELVLTVWRKKLELLKKATTVKECEIIRNPSAPIYDQYGETFKTDNTWVAEEELIQWSLASLRAPLPPDAAKRYLDLFEQVFKADMYEITQI